MEDFAQAIAEATADKSVAKCLHGLLIVSLDREQAPIRGRLLHVVEWISTG